LTELRFDGTANPAQKSLKSTQGNSMVQHVGVDGCRFGWVAVFEDNGELLYRLFSKFAELVAFFPAANFLVDIPIGLPWNACPVRPCDALARKNLGPGRASSVFPAPSRDACRASDVNEARRLNEAELGKSLSAQAWGICPKIAEVDVFMLSNPTAQLRVREMHPEV
jgi:predicted RNase H-like nuclease